MVYRKGALSIEKVSILTLLFYLFVYITLIYSARSSFVLTRPYIYFEYTLLSKVLELYYSLLVCLNVKREFHSFSNRSLTTRSRT